MLRAPNGHTSIYLCPYVKKHWRDVNRLQINKGNRSFNQLMNVMLVEELKKSPTKHGKGIDMSKRLNPYDDSKITVREKLKTHSDGEAYDVFKILTEMRDTVISDLNKRGMKL